MQEESLEQIDIQLVHIARYLELLGNRNMIETRKLKLREKELILKKKEILETQKSLQDKPRR